MPIRKLLSQATKYNLQIELIDKRITHLTTMANTIVDNDFEYVELIMETYPKNGAQPIVVPLYAQADVIPYLANDAPIKAPPQIGFQRYYPASELKDAQMLTISFPLEANITLAAIDRILARLRQQKTQLLKDSAKIMKAR